MNLTYTVLVALNILLVTWRCINRWTSKEQPPAQHPSYGYRGDDYPFELPLDESSGPVAMTLHETVHFPFNMSDPIAQMEWDNLVTAPKEAGRTRLGPDHRVFTMVFWHHFHCLWSIQRALNDRNDTYAGYGHLHHCFNYLRQTLLCQAADTLELGDFMERDFENNRVGDTLVCRDWEQVYDTMDENYQDWTEWAKQWN
ncbi:hypothetical protein EV363DRAFT_1357498 [Boletus edulis]|uniref:Oxidase ustYa n=1 Tax=Boletus edulis BED1 TaxID=1328754 RepID=A0AAD4GAU7_BOLED|nr:hypothetical protein EV363DRAFT_1357498 [Boletus edulis]KAF8433677.1 hypothetical protein L210DRAFT_3649500 [Boletus edulis BED1]